MRIKLTFVFRNEEAVQIIESIWMVPSWLLSSFFRLGLNPDLEPYTFQMVKIARTQKRELEINEMIIALVDHDRRQQFSEDTKALAIKKGKGSLL